MLEKWCTILHDVIKSFQARFIWELITSVIWLSFLNGRIVFPSTLTSKCDYPLELEGKNVSSFMPHIQESLWRSVTWWWSGPQVNTDPQSDCNNQAQLATWTSRGSLRDRLALLHDDECDHKLNTHDAENGIYIKQCTPVIVHEALRDVWIITFHLGKVEFLIMRWKIWQTIWQQCSPEKTPPHWYNIKMSWICDFHQINMLWL